MRFVKTKTVNNKAFDDLTNEYTQYILGFLAADGCLSINPKKKVSFSSKDKGLLEKIQAALKTDYKVGFDGRSGYQLQIYSDRLYDRAIELGMSERKSLTLSYPKWANRHFVRGYFDGDGSVWKVHKRPSINCEFNTGSRIFAHGLENHLIILGLEAPLRRDCLTKGGKPFFKITVYRQSDIRHIYDIMYEESTICLNRKRNVFQKWLSKTLNIGESLEVGNAET